MTNEEMAKLENALEASEKGWEPMCWHRDILAKAYREAAARPQNAEPKAMSDARELAKRFDTIWEILMDWLNDHPRICQRSSVEDLRSLCDTLVAFAQTVARAALHQALKG